VRAPSMLRRGGPHGTPIPTMPNRALRAHPYNDLMDQSDDEDDDEDEGGPPPALADIFASLLRPPPARNAHSTDINRQLPSFAYKVGPMDEEKCNICLVQLQRRIQIQLKS
jgi:hypothetical protein